MAIALTMTMFIIFYVKLAPIYPEYNRDRMVVLKAVKCYPKDKPENYNAGALSDEVAEMLDSLPHLDRMATTSRCPSSLRAACCRNSSNGEILTPPSGTASRTESAPSPMIAMPTWVKLSGLPLSVAVAIASLMADSAPTWKSRSPLRSSGCLCPQAQPISRTPIYIIKCFIVASLGDTAKILKIFYN